MICTRCKKEINFNQWIAENCHQPSWESDFHTAGRHTGRAETSIRDAYLAMLTEAAYSRIQP